MSRTFTLTAALLVLVAVAHADSLVLETGERIRGTVAKEENGVVYFQSNALGLLVLPVARVGIEFELPASKDSDPRKSSAASMAEFKPVDLRTAMKSPKRALKAPLTGWRRIGEFGFTSQSGRSDKTDIALRFEADRRGAKSETRLLTRYLYGETNGERTTDNIEASLRLRRNLSNVLFAQSVTTYAHDTIKRITNEANQGFGLGRNLSDREDFVLAVGGGAAGRYREQLGELSEIDYTVDAFQDISFAINGRFTLNQDFSLTVPPENPDEYKLLLHASLTGKITDTLKLSMRYEIEYDRSLRDDVRDTQRTVTAIGYAF